MPASPEDVAAANARATVALSDYLHSLDTSLSLAWHVRHKLAQRLADVAVQAVYTTDEDFDR
jgi:hypothetical protein